ncbi:CAP domain-containing protein [Mucidula mucida]|nr:CAP domain-containing protein [Mucidula mucida]
MLFTKSIVAIMLAATASALSVPNADVIARDAGKDNLKVAVLANHNAARLDYGATALTWSEDLYAAALDWANTCKFQHSHGKYGENLYATTGKGGDPIKLAVSAWMAEASQYDYDKPGFSSTTGHFTQVVWKNTKSVTCAVGQCPAGTIFRAASQYVVCRYSPPGNYVGQFEANVGRYV